MSISNATSRPGGAPRPGSTEQAAAPAQTPAAGPAPAATPAAKTAAAEATKADHYVQAQSTSLSSTSLGPGTARPSRATDLGKLVKPAESALLRISETRGPQVAAEMRQLDRAIDAKARDGATALGPVGEGVAKAVDETTNRVLGRLAEGKITPEDARTAMQQLDLASEALKMVKDGNLPNLQRGGVNLLDEGVKTLTFDIKKGNDTYTAQLLSRPEQGYGEPRVNIQILKKNGETLPPDQQVSIRTDLAKIDGRASVDVASGFLDQKIHGPMMGPDGKPLKGGKVPDHHFHAGIPDSLHSTQAYAGFVRDFEQKYVDPKLGQLPPVQGIAYQTDNKVSAEAIGKFHGAQAAQKLTGLNDSIDAMAREGAKTLGPAGEAVARAVDTTTDRILGRVAAGTLSPQEAEQAFGETRLLANVLKTVQEGKLQGFEQGGVNLSDPSFRGFKFTMKDGNDTYGVKVTTRSEAGGGEARLGFAITEKNGQKLSPFQELGLRVDLQKFDGKAAVDIDSSLLDRQVHGAMDPSHTGGRKGIPDHHFKDGLPEALNDPAAYAKFVTDFRDTHMKPPQQ
jgi:hypothetical protein